MNKPVQLSIPSPCAEGWDEMTPDARGRFCAHCQKSVIDFTSWSDKMLYDFFAKNKGEICGRLRTDQLSRVLSLPPRPHSKLYRIAIALGLTILAAQAHEAHARTPPPLVERYIVAPVKDTAGNDTVVIKGLVLDEKKEPMIGVAVRLEKENGAIMAGAATDIDGYFYIPVPDTLHQALAGTQLQLEVQAPGYNSQLIRVDLAQRTVCDIQLGLKKMSARELSQVGAIIMTSEHRSPLTDAGKTGPNKIFTTKDLHHMGY